MIVYLLFKVKAKRSSLFHFAYPSGIISLAGPIVIACQSSNCCWLSGIFIQNEYVSRAIPPGMVLRGNYLLTGAELKGIILLSSLVMRKR